MAKRIRVGLIDPNPFHDFSLHPLDRGRIGELKDSINKNTFWDNVVVRPSPVQPGRYEQAYGHHRLAAVRELNGDDFEVNLPVRRFDDYNMLTSMVTENSTQYGNSPSAILDSVAALTKYVATVLLSAENWGQGMENFPYLADVFPPKSDKDRSAFSVAKTLLLKGEGVGRPIIKRLSGNTLSDGEIRDAVETLKASGRYDKLILQAKKDADKYRRELKDRQDEEDRRAAERLEKEKLTAQQQAEQAQSEKDRAAKALERQVAKEERLKREAEEAAANRDDSAAEKKAAAKDAARARREAEKVLEEVEKDRLKKSAARAQVSEELSSVTGRIKKRTKASDAEDEMVQKAKNTAPIYDDRCTSLFVKASHRTRFRHEVTAGNNAELFPVDRQYEVAEALIKSAKDTKTELTVAYISQYLNGEVEYFVKSPQRKEQAALEKKDPALRANKAWERARDSHGKYCTALEHLATALDKGAPIPGGEDFRTEWQYMQQEIDEAQTKVLKAAHLLGAKGKLIEDGE